MLIGTGKKRRLCDDATQPDNSSQASHDTYGPDQAERDSACSRHVAERLSKLEQLFERFVCRKSTIEVAPTNALPSPVPLASVTNEKDMKPLSPPSSVDIRSMSSVGDGIVRSSNKAFVNVELTITARCSKMGISTIHSVSGRQAGEWEKHRIRRPPPVAGCALAIPGRR